MAMQLIFLNKGFDVVEEDSGIRLMVFASISLIYTCMRAGGKAFAMANNRVLPR